MANVGSAADPARVVAFYDTRFNIGFSDQDIADPVEFIPTL